MTRAAAKPEPSGTPGQDRTERDQSADAQRHAEPSGKAVGRQAHRDVERGLADTSRADEADATYNEGVLPGAPPSSSR